MSALRSTRDRGPEVKTLGDTAFLRLWREDIPAQQTVLWREKVKGICRPQPRERPLKSHKPLPGDPGISTHWLPVPIDLATAHPNPPQDEREDVGINGVLSTLALNI